MGLVRWNGDGSFGESDVAREWPSSALIPVVWLREEQVQVSGDTWFDWPGRTLEFIFILVSVYVIVSITCQGIAQAQATKGAGDDPNCIARMLRRRRIAAFCVFFVGVILWVAFGIQDVVTVVALVGGGAAGRWVCLSIGLGVVLGGILVVIGRMFLYWIRTAGLLADYQQARASALNGRSGLGEVWGARLMRIDLLFPVCLCLSYVLYRLFRALR